MNNKNKRSAARIEAELLSGEIESVIEDGVQKLHGPEAREDTYHNTKRLLRQYRRVEYAVRMSEEEMGLRAEADYGIALSPLEVNAELAGIDLSGTRLEGYTRSIVRSKRILEVINNALERVKENPERGDELYEVLYQTYFTPKKARNREDLLNALARKGFAMSKSQYYVMLKKSVEVIDKLLWGFTAKDCLEFAKLFSVD